MEVLSCLNRLTIFGDDPNEVSEVCAQLESLTTTINPRDVPDDALRIAASLIMSNCQNKPSIVCCCCNILSFCCMSDSSDTKILLVNSAGIVPACTECLRFASAAEVDSIQRWGPAAFAILDLMASLTYNCGEARAALGPVISLIASLLANLLKKPSTASVWADCVFGCVSSIALLCMADRPNADEAACAAPAILELFARLNQTAPIKGRPMPIAAAADRKSQISDWCRNALRNMIIGTPNNAAWLSLPFGRMGDVVAVDHLKWELTSLQKKVSK